MKVALLVLSILLTVAAQAQENDIFQEEFPTGIWLDRGFGLWERYAICGNKVLIETAFQKHKPRTRPKPALSDLGALFAGVMKQLVDADMEVGLANLKLDRMQAQLDSVTSHLNRQIAILDSLEEEAKRPRKLQPLPLYEFDIPDVFIKDKYYFVPL